MKRWFPEVVGYFERKITNGIVEGINNKLKLLKPCGFGRIFIILISGLYFYGILLTI
uniref:transposase n=1 Tax=Microseira wollei TaxID=467598 RepID=UPI001CFE47B7|nr:transposase [Microseira wollei]